MDTSLSPTKLARPFWPCLVVIAFLGSNPALHAADRVTSKYTSTARKNALSYTDHSKVPEGGFEAVFRGFGDYQLVHLDGDERSWINVRYRRQTIDLYGSTMRAGGGTFPHKANDVVEWRGVEKNGRFLPHAIIYRIAAGNDETRRIHTRLIVIKLDKERSAVVGHAEGANEERDARAFADAALKQ
jgi:hypothetical protein